MTSRSGHAAGHAVGHSCGRSCGHRYGQGSVDEFHKMLMDRMYCTPDLWTGMRAYDETITWIRFRADLRNAPPSFWLLSGECIALARHLQGSPIPPAESRSLDRELNAYGLLARLSMDGSPLRAEQVLGYLEKGSRVPEQQANIFRSVDLLRDTEELLRARLSAGPLPFSPTSILDLHRELVRSGNGGAWRSTEISDGPLEKVPSEMVGLFMEEFCDWMNGPDLAAPSAAEDPHYALIRTLLCELYIAWIRPFGAGDHQIAGLLGMQLMATHGMVGAWTHLIAVHFHRSKPEYKRQVEQAARQLDPVPFLAYGLRGLLDALREVERAVRSAQTDGQWQAYVWSLFNAPENAQRSRQRELLLALGSVAAPIAQSEIPELNPVLARLYAGVSQKTLKRDVDALEELGTLQRTDQGVRARREVVLGFRS